MMYTLHPTSKKTADGFLPMITVRGAKGRMIGSRTPQEPLLLCDTHEMAQSLAYSMALQVTLQPGSGFLVSVPKVSS